MFEAPVDVQLDCDDRTMVEPDVLIVCDRATDIVRNEEKLPDIDVFSGSDMHQYRGVCCCGNYLLVRAVSYTSWYQI